ncbi:MAG: hypothetical protein H6558_15545 [Lewinellaceae bacterium]|nr:hypothetical protein [Lewinellaceae bacterium]
MPVETQTGSFVANYIQFKGYFSALWYFASFSPALLRAVPYFFQLDGFNGFAA